MAEVLYPIDDAQVHRHSSIDQFSDGFLSVYKQGGWAPIVFDQLDGITCETIKSHPVILSFGDDIGYIFPEAHCQFTSDKFVYFDKEGVEQRPLPSCFGGKGEFYDVYVDKSSFINFDSNDSLSTSDKFQLRTGLSYVLAEESLPPAE